MNYQHLTQTLVECFSALADEVQALTDRKTILEHKLRYAHEQFQFLADKHAPAAPEISETLARLQLPPELHHPSLTEVSRVPLPQRSNSDSRHKIALVIRDGRRVAQQLASLADVSKTSLSSRDVFSRASRAPSSMSTELEQDFTVEGKKGRLGCPFSRTRAGEKGEGEGEGGGGGGGETREADEPAYEPAYEPADEPADEPAAADDVTPHHRADPICAAMHDESTGRPTSPGSASAAATKCPIRFLDRHSPEEIAHYVETHKHQIPRSHSVCVGRYQRNAEQIRKLDSKYGSLVNMIQGLSHLHKPMLPSASAVAEDVRTPRSDVDRVSNERVECWAQAVSASRLVPADVDKNDADADADAARARELAAEGEAEREGRFDRPLKEVRVGESPSRPWGISVPVTEPYRQDEDGRPLSPPPAPVVTLDTNENASAAKKCPFDHSNFVTGLRGPPAKHAEKSSVHGGPPPPPPPPPPPATTNEPSSPLPQPAFVDPSPPQDTPGSKQEWPPAYGGSGGGPRMVFTGPVFIGYPIEQAMQLLNNWQGGR